MPMPSVFTENVFARTVLLEMENNAKVSIPIQELSIINPAPTPAISQVIFLLFLFTEISDICIPNPCKNSGKCVNAPQDSFDCICVKGFTGPLCECKSSFFTPTVTSTYFTFQ